MEKLVRPTRGTRFIGISNFSPPQVSKILETATIKPKVHQFELHPYLQQSDFVETHVKHGINVIGYAPLGNTNPILDLGVSENRGLRVEKLLTNNVITEIAKARGCTPAQVVLAWNIRRKVIVIPKAARSEHQKENIVTLDKCKITDEDAHKIKSMKIAVRLYPFACGYGLTEGCD
jgi:alcohol dehydrogenase (NADP+)